MPNPRLVVTGANGFVGRHLVSAAAAAGWRVTALVRRPGTLDDLPAGVEAVDWNLDDPSGITHLLPGSVICHVAAFVPAEMTEPRHAERCFRVNALGTLALLRVALAAGARRFVYFSTGNLYARHDLRPATEANPLYPSHHAPYYLTSKLTGEVFVEHFREAHGLSSASLRLSAVYGPGMPRGFVIEVARKLKRGQRVELLDSGRYTVDLVWVDDVVRAALAAARSEVPGPINVGSGRGATLLEVAETLAEILGVDPELLQVLPAETGPIPGFRALDISRARRELDFVPTPLAAGLRQLAAALT